MLRPSPVRERGKILDLERERDPAGVSVAPHLVSLICVPGGAHVRTPRVTAELTRPMRRKS